MWGATDCRRGCSVGVIRGITIPSPEETMSNKTGRNEGTYISALLIALSLLMVSVRPAETQNSPATSVQNTPAQIHALKVTLLSTMLVGSTTGLGEWGFSALIEADSEAYIPSTGSWTSAGSTIQQLWDS